MKIDKLSSTKVKIAGREYPMKVKESEKQLIQGVAREINDRIKDFQHSYNDRDLQDCIVMTLLTYAVEYHQNDSKANVNNNDESKGVKNKLSEINSLLDYMLQS